MFGKGPGRAPGPVEEFVVLRGDSTYHFQIEGFNEPGISKRGEVIKVP